MTRTDMMKAKREWTVRIANIRHSAERAEHLQVALERERQLAPLGTPGRAALTAMASHSAKMLERVRRLLILLGDLEGAETEDEADLVLARIANLAQEAREVGDWGPDDWPRDQDLR